MYRIATNEALTYLKRDSRIQGVSDTEIRESQLASLTADPWFDGDQAELELQEALARLPEKQRLVFNMKYFEQLKYEEISEILETSVGALKASYHLAAKKIEKHIKNADR
jgi:RNA polymerase sigma-70 factor (ECF subfamily)